MNTLILLVSLTCLPPWFPHDKVVDNLKQGWEEKRTLYGPTGSPHQSSEFIMQLFESEQGTWTIIITDTNKCTRSIASGHGLVHHQPGQGT